MKPPKGYKIISLDESSKALEEYLEKGAEPGLYVGYECLKDYYSMKLGSCTDWTGSPQSGKSQLMLQLLHYTSAQYGLKHLLLVPDIGEFVEVLDILVHIHTGKTMDKRYRNLITIRELFSANNWLSQHFFILEPSESTNLLTPIEFWEYACSIDVQTAVIDSWKDMNHQYEKHGGSYAKYLSSTLSTRNFLAQKHKKHFHTVIHPKNPRRLKDGSKASTDVDDMEGGAQWNNSGKSIIGCNRATFDTRIVDIDVLKAKPRVVGKRGQAALELDVEKSAYFERGQSDGRAFYAGELKKYLETEHPLGFATPSYYEPPDKDNVPF